MGAIAEGIVAYGQPLIDQTDGSHEQLERAFALTQICFNLSMLPAAQQEQMICDMQSQMEMNDEEFQSFRRSIIEPMIARHHQMFPLMHQHRSPLQLNAWEDDAHVVKRPIYNLPATHSGKQTATVDRYAPCPCNSGKKYKFCCEQKNR